MIINCQLATGKCPWCGYTTDRTWRKRNCPAKSGKRSLHLHGPGTELRKLIKELGLQEKAGCQCAKRAAEMNSRGIEWCRENRDTIVGWLKESAAQASWAEKFAAIQAARSAEWFRWLDPYGSLVDEAVRRAESHASNHPQLASSP